MKNFYKQEQSGRSMVEMLGVLAIIGVLSIGGISGYSKAMSKYRINKTLDQISMLVMNIRSLYSSSVDYEGLEVKSALAMGAIPSDMQAGLNSDDTEIYNAYQGQVIVKADKDNSNNRKFTVAYYGLPRDACITLATSDWGSQAGSGLESIGIGATEADKKSGAPTTTYLVKDLPLNLAIASTVCQSDTAAANGNTVLWTYY